MAKVLFSGVAGVDLRNKLNGSVFSKNRGGAYVRTKVTPVNPQTTAQQAARNRLSTNSQAWRGLSESQRQGWIDGAANFPYTDIYGQTKILSGQQLYVKLNNNVMVANGGSINDCPAPVAIPAITGLTVTADESAHSVLLSIDPDPTSDVNNLFIFATPNVTPGKMFVKNLYRFVKNGGTEITGAYDISSSWTSLFGNPVAGQKIFVKIFYVNPTTGQAGIPIQAMTIVVA